MTDEAQEAAPVPHDETHDSIDPVTGTLTGDALLRRQAIADHVQRHRVANAKEGENVAPLGWLDAFAYWVETMGESDPTPPAPESEPDQAATAEPGKAGEKLFG